jgi:hypothetical protein
MGKAGLKLEFLVISCCYYDLLPSEEGCGFYGLLGLVTTYQ